MNESIRSNVMRVLRQALVVIACLMGRGMGGEASSTDVLFIRPVTTGEAPDKAASLLTGWDPLPLTLQGTLQEKQRLRESRRPFNPAVTLVMAEAVDAAPKAPAAPRPPAPLSAYDQLQLFEEAGKLESPECVALARDVLFKFADSKQPLPSSTENCAIRTLVVIGKFTPFLDDLRVRLEQAGKPELEIQRALYRVHLYRVVHAKGEMVPYAKRILELDPADLSAAREVLDAAIRAQDRPLAASCLAMLSRQSKVAFCAALETDPNQYGNRKPGALPLFTGQHAGSLAEALLRQPLAAPGRSSQGFDPQRNTRLRPLVEHFAEHDPEHLKPILRWASVGNPDACEELISSTANFRSERASLDAMDVLTEIALAPPPAALDDSRLQPLKPHGCWDKRLQLVLGLALPNRLKLFRDAVGRHPVTPATADLQTLLEMALNPTPETWDRLMPGFLATVEDDRHREAKSMLLDLARSLPESANLQLHLTDELAPESTRPPSFDELVPKLLLAARADLPDQIATHWQALKPLCGKADRIRREQFVYNATDPLAMHADDTVWQEFLAEFKNANTLVTTWEAYRVIHRVSELPAQRVKDLVAVIVPGLRPKLDRRDQVISLFDRLAGEEPVDVALLDWFRPWLALLPTSEQNGPSPSPRQQFLDLASGHLAAVSPVLNAVAQADQTCRIEWSLAGFKGNRSGFAFAPEFPFIDGHFDLHILAGSHPEQLEIITTIPTVKCTGQTRVQLPPGAVFVALMAKEHTGTKIRWSHPVRLAPVLDTRSLALTPVLAGKPDPPVTLNRLAGKGPFGLCDAFTVTVPSKGTIELARLPWTVGSLPALSGWIQSARSGSHLLLSYRDGDGVEIGLYSLESNRSDFQSMPIWRPIRISDREMPPPETESIVLAVRAESTSGAMPLLLADLRTAPSPDQTPPDGFVLAGRIPGAVNVAAVASPGDRIVVGSNKNGVGVMDLATGKFSGWIPVGKNPLESRTEIVWVASAGDRILAADDSGQVYLISLAQRTPKPILQLNPLVVTRRDPNPEGPLIRLSPDGKLLAWGGLMAGLNIAGLGADGMGRKITLTTGQLNHLRFDQTRDLLEASDGINQYRLPLAAWEKAELQTTPVDRFEDQVRSTASALYRSECPLRDEVHRIGFQPGYDITVESVSVDPAKRVVSLPRGLVGLDAKGTPLFISNFGQVFRIDTTKLEGYQPAP